MAGPATHFGISAPATASAVAAFTITVTALDASNGTDTTYAGTVHFTASDGQAILPANSTLTNGVGTFSVTLKTAGSQSIIATDTVDGTISGTSLGVTVSSATHFSVSAPASVTSGNSFSVTVTARDASNNTDTFYSGTVHFITNDGQAVLPADSTLTNGVGTFSVTLKTAGSQNITAIEVASGISGTSNTISVSSSAATHFTVSAPASATSGSAFSVTVTALDAFNNTATGYIGTVHFTATDGQAILPANSTLTNGVGTFSVTLKTAGVQNITATDTVTPAITGTSGTINVSGAAATHFTVSAPASATSGSAFSVTVTALDAFNNTATGYIGTVHFTATDGQAILPANSTLTNGVGTFSVTLKTVGSQTVTAIDTVSPAITGTSGTINVSGAAATHFTVSAPASVTSGSAFSVTVTAKDQFNNTATSYTGTVHFTATDGQAILPANSSLTNGIGTFSVTLKTAGNQTITATDTVSPAITGTSGTISVSAAPATHFSVSAPASVISGTAFSITITALDASNNTVTGYSGTVHFTATDGQATLPANSTLTNGIGTFSVTLKTAGSQTVTAIDTVSPAITGTSNAISVSGAAATHFSVSAPASATSGSAFSVTVTAKDQFNNTATSYTGTVHFTATDGQAILPANSSLTNGIGTFSVTLKTAGNQTITATDTVSPAITGTSGTISVSGAAATHFSVSAPASVISGTAFSVTVTARDASNNVATYGGTVHFTATDGQAILPANSTLTGGIGTFSVTLKTAGNQTVTATDTVSPAITGTSNAITVGMHATATTLSSSPNPSTASQAVVLTATVTSSGATPGGTVTFSDGGVAIGSALLAGGVATFTTAPLSAGNHTIVASYAGATGFSASTSAALLQVVNIPADSLKLRAMQILTTPVAAQASGQAISGALDTAIGEAFSGGGGLITPTANGIRFNFAADSDEPAVSKPPGPIDRAAGGGSSFASNGRDARSSRVDDAFNALAHAAPAKAPPVRPSEPKDWLAWAEVRGAVLDHWPTPGSLGGAPRLHGDQINLLAGLTRRVSPNFIVGVAGGWETFDYRSDELSGRLKGDGWTVGAYLGWKLAQNIRYDAAVAYSGIGYDSTAGIAAGSFAGKRVLAMTGLTGTYSVYDLVIEPSARVYALWEHEDAYTDTLGTLQTARNFSTGRASGGVKLIYPFAWTASVALAPYAGLYGDYYFNTDDGLLAATALIPAAIVQDGWSARAVGGISARFDNGGQFSFGAERAGIGANFVLWTYRARASLPFSAR